MDNVNKCEKILKTEHIPTKHQLLIFRLWEMVSSKKIAQILHTSEEKVIETAYDMGLPPQKHLDNWIERGYISIIRAVWNLLPYEQICQLLEWDMEQLSYILKEDDYLGEKLGEKCYCPYVYYRELTEIEKKQTERIKESILKFIRPIQSEEVEAPFEFFTKRYKTFTEKKTYTVTVDSSWAIKADVSVSGIINNFKVFAQKYGILFSEDSEKRIRICIDNQYGKDEDHKISISETEILITAATSSGVLRALYYIEDLVESAGGFCFEAKTYRRKTRIKTRFIYSFCGLYESVLDCDTNVSFPDELLEEYARKGINGVWIQGVLYKLAPYPFDESLCDGWKMRLENLRELTKRADRFGIKVYIYLNEPRNMPLSFFDNYPELKGATLNEGTACLCSSNNVVHKYLSEVLKVVCEAAPLLGGFFCITQTENRVLCCSNGRNTIDGTQCPVCSTRKPSDVISKILTTMSDAVWQVNPEMKFFYFAWSLAHTIGEEETKALIEKLNKNIIIMQVSETEMPFERSGVKDEILDYSMSIIGPGECAKKQWRIAKKTGHETAAKVQINNSWEASTAPFIPVYDNVVKHMENLVNEGVEHLMLSWTLGGYISDNIKIASAFFFENEEDAYDDILTRTYGEYKGIVKESVEHFCKGFSNYPFNWKHIYVGPSNSGVANLLYLEKTGMRATMTCYPYDDIYSWRGIAAKNPNETDNPLYPVEVLEKQYSLICDEWEKGLEIITTMPVCEFKDMAVYTYTLFKSSLNQIQFYIERDGKRDIKKMKDIVRKEKELALTAYEIMLRNSAVGYEAANHYYVTRSMLVEKVVQCDYLIGSMN